MPVITRPEIHVMKFNQKQRLINGTTRKTIINLCFWMLDTCKIEIDLGSGPMTVLRILASVVTRQWEKINNYVPLYPCLIVTLPVLHTLSSEKETDQCDKIYCTIALKNLLVGFYQKHSTSRIIDITHAQRFC